MLNNHYLRDPLDHIPHGLLTLADYEQQAQHFIRPGIYAHISGGSGKEITLNRNSQAYDRIGIMPKALINFSATTTSSTLLGQQLKHPLLLAPTAYQTLVHPEGELASSKAADIFALPTVCSTLSSYSLEKVAAKSNGIKWFQLYTQNNMTTSIDLIKRAENSGYSALVITVDSAVTGLRHRAQRAGFTMPNNVIAENLTPYENDCANTLPPDSSLILNGFMQQAPDWQTLEVLRSKTNLPVILKGLLNPADVLHAQQAGFAGAIISNHGGRSLDGLPATIDVLPAIRNAIGNDFLLLLDSGIRSGSDIFKALAMGANAVLVGRPIYYALAIAGALGVAHMLRTLIEEFELTMALAGCPTLADINAKSVFNQS